MKVPHYTGMLTVWRVTRDAHGTITYYPNPPSGGERSVMKLSRKPLSIEAILLPTDGTLTVGGTLTTFNRGEYLVIQGDTLSISSAAALRRDFNFPAVLLPKRPHRKRVTPPVEVLPSPQEERSSHEEQMDLLQDEPSL
jgi:hypothetical protein